MKSIQLLTTVVLILAAQMGQANVLPGTDDPNGKFVISDCKDKDFPNVNTRHYGRAEVLAGVIEYGSTEASKPHLPWHRRPAKGELRIKLLTLNKDKVLYSGQALYEGKLHVGVSDYNQPISGLVGSAIYTDLSTDDRHGHFSVNFNQPAVEGYHDISFNLPSESRTYWVNCKFTRSEEQSTPNASGKFDLPGPTKFMGPYKRLVELKEFNLTLNLSDLSTPSKEMVQRFYMKIGQPYKGVRSEASIRAVRFGADEIGQYVAIHLGTTPVTEVHVYLKTNVIYLVPSDWQEKTKIGTLSSP